MAYYRLEPFGEEKADVRNARLLAMLANVNSDGSKQFEPADFMPDEGAEVEEPSVSDKARAIFGGSASINPSRQGRRDN